MNSMTTKHQFTANHSLGVGWSEGEKCAPLTRGGLERGRFGTGAYAYPQLNKHPNLYKHV